MIIIYVIAIVYVIVFCALRLGTWRGLNALGADVGRGIAWFCSGGLGLQMARYHLGHLRQQQAMADLQARLAAERWRNSAFPAGERVRMLAQGGIAIPRPGSFGEQLDRFEPRTGWQQHAPPCRCAWCTRKPGQRAAWD